MDMQNFNNNKQLQCQFDDLQQILKIIELLREVMMEQ